MRMFQDVNNPELVKLLRGGAVGVLPTDTVYGLVCRAADEEAVMRLYKTKGRDGKPGTIIAAKIQQLVDLGIRARYLKAVEYFWPGSISIIVPADLGYLNQGVAGLALRIPDDEPLRELLGRTGALQTTSANAPGEPTATTVEAARDYFGDNVDFYVDGGDLSDRQSSTVIRIVDDAIEILREGAVKVDESGRVVR